MIFRVLPKRKAQVNNKFFFTKNIDLHDRPCLNEICILKAVFVCPSAFQKLYFTAITEFLSWFLAIFRFLFLAKESVLCQLVLLIFSLGTWKMQNIRLTKIVYLVQAVKLSENLCILVKKWSHSIKKMKSSWKLPVSMYQNCVPCSDI